MIRSIQILNQTIQVDTDGDYYGEVFWDKINCNQWEPDTFDFIGAHCNANTQFLDVGAANGAMSLAAALCGSETKAYEPDPIILNNLIRNVALNPSLAKLIEVNHCAIGIENGHLNFENESDPEILTNILFRERHFEPTQVEVKSFKLELVSAAKTGKNIVIKMDIEGAEFKLMKDIEILRALKESNALLLLAIHPGFNRTYKKSRLHPKISEKLWQRRNNEEVSELFLNISSFAEIRRTNMNRVKNKDQFSSLANAGYHEFVINFQEDYFI